MPSEKILAAKKQVVADLVADFKEAKTFVFVASRGLTVEQDTNMRRELRAGNVKFQVVKNTVLRLVFKELGIEGLDEIFEGPTAVADQGRCNRWQGCFYRRSRCSFQGSGYRDTLQPGRIWFAFPFYKACHARQSCS